MMNNTLMAVGEEVVTTVVVMIEVRHDIGVPVETVRDTVGRHVEASEIGRLSRFSVASVELGG